MRYISGIRPSGRLHLGNYIGSILPALKYDSDVLVADLHSPFGDVGLLQVSLERFFDKEKIKLQSENFDTLLFFQLLEITPSGLLHHMPQYKAKEKTALMFSYPVLMAHDIAGYDFVIVGDDQKPHIEFANDILPKMGLKCPEPIYEGGKVMDLRHPERKMSKSTPESCLFMDDTPEVAERKIMKAVTDEAGRKNLEFIFEALGGEFAPQSNEGLKREVVIRFNNIERQ